MVFLLSCVLSNLSYAENPVITAPVIKQETLSESKLTDETLSTLLKFIDLLKRLKKDLNSLKRELSRAKTDTEKNELKAALIKIEEKIKGTEINIENIASNTDLNLLRITKPEPFNLQKELFSLLEPALKEMKHATSDVRQKSDLREKISYYQQREPVAREALRNIAILNRANGAKNKSIQKALRKMNKTWNNQLIFIERELQAKKLQLSKLEAQEISFAIQSEDYFRHFFQRRGWTLIEAFLVIVLVLLISKYIHKLITRTITGYRAEHRSVHLRVTDLLHRFITYLFVIVGPLIVFYIEEDWVLFSLGILLLISIAWTLRSIIPRYWGQLELFLNVGPVREGERLMLNGIPWRVKNINMYSILENPIAGLSQRVDIDELVDLRSRPIELGEPWFPCKRGDWVHLSDGIRGKITGISIEFIQLIQRGGAVITYTMGDFLSLSPKNISKNFRIKETFGIGYVHQNQSTNEIIGIMKAALNKRAIEEGYKDDFHNINVEFESAADSSLNLVVIADFKGSVADIYMRLRRSIQRWCVDVCTENNWDIPFPQLTVHSDLKHK